MAQTYEAGSARPVFAGPRLDRLPICAFHWRIMFLIGAGLFLDAFEIYLGGSVVGALLKSGWSTLELNATFVTMTFAGLVVGAWGAGILGDRFGRRFSYQLNLAIFGLASLAAVFAPNMTVLIGLRFIMGIGLGAELVIGYATLTEFVPAAHRGRLVAILAFIANSAVFVASLTSLWVIPTFGWQYMFLIVGVAALIVWFLRQAMPESPRWLEAKGRTDEAEAILRAIEAEAAAQGPLAPYDQAKPRSVRAISLAAVFTPPYLGRTLMGALIFITIGVSIYGLVAWLPSFFVKQGHSIVSSLTWSTVMTFGGPVGGLIGMTIADRIGRKAAVVGASAIAALFGLIYQFPSDDMLLLLTGFLLISALYTMIVVAQAIYVPELFPTEFRMRGTGVCSTAGRLTSAFIQFGIVALFTWGGVNAVVGTVAAVLLFQAVVIAIFGVETKKRTLEDISAVPATG
jgi:putative MFS transporter